MARFLIGIDDTDNDTSIGTGRLARQFADLCRRQGLSCVGVTRHQFLVDPAIPYTSHNSGVCLLLDADVEPADLGFAFEFVAQSAAVGSDPGVCVAPAERVCRELLDFGRAAAREVLTMDQAFAAAGRAGVSLRGLGGTCLGVIGALAAVGQCAGGNEGRFIDLPGLRLLPTCVRRHEFAEMGIRVEHGAREVPPGDDDCYETLGWVRPRLIGGEAVLLVEWSDARNAWSPVDRRQGHSSR
jgi:hypothetical protein